MEAEVGELLVMQGVLDLRAFQATRSTSPTIARGPCAARTEDVEIGVLVFRCPKTYGDIGSGIEMDQHTFRQIKQLSVLVLCRLCRQVHEFKASAGTLAPFGAAALRNPPISNYQSSKCP
jgi:hypothetical protein